MVSFTNTSTRVALMLLPTRFGHSRHASATRFIRLLTTDAVPAFATYRHWFPKDTITLAQMELYARLAGGEDKHTVQVGVVYDSPQCQQLLKMVPVLLADPLAAGSRRWFETVATRDHTQNHTFIYNTAQLPVLLANPDLADTTELLDSVLAVFRRLPDQPEDNSGAEVFMVPSPILSSVYRIRWPDEPPATTEANDISLTEINNVDAADLAKFDYLIRVTRQFTPRPLPPQLAQRVLLTVVDNAEFTPPLIELTPAVWDPLSDQHVIKINSQLAYDGIEDYYIQGPKAGHQFADATRMSNLYQLLKAVGWFLRTEVLRGWLLEEITKGVSGQQTTVEELDTLLAKLSREDVAKFSEGVHHELQYEFAPATTKFFNKQLLWWRLYYKNDNVEYDLKDFFQEHFMPKLIEHYNYMRGHIALAMQNQPYGEYHPVAAENPLAELKSDLLQNQIAGEVQPQVYRILSRAFIQYQLPITVLAIAGYLYTGLSANALVAIGLLGWVVGFNHVSRDWLKFSRQWLDQLFERVRVTAGRDCVDHGLLEEVKDCYQQEVAMRDAKQSVLSEISNLKP